MSRPFNSHPHIFADGSAVAAAANRLDSDDGDDRYQLMLAAAHRARPAHITGLLQHLRAGAQFVAGPKRNLDSIGGANLLKRNLDSIGGANLLKRSVDSLGGAYLLKRK